MDKGREEEEEAVREWEEETRGEDVQDGRLCDGWMMVSRSVTGGCRTKRVKKKACSGNRTSAAFPD